MATRTNYELLRPEIESSTETPPALETVITQQPQSQTSVAIVRVFTWWELLDGAARRVYGDKIILHQNLHTKNELDKLVADLLFTVIDCEPQPRESKQTIIDMSSKEYINRSEHEKDETFVKTSKTPLAIGSRYNFYPKSGVSWTTNGNLGTQILSMAMSGGTMRVGDGPEGQVYGQDNAVNPQLGIQYNQEEKLTIPPGTKVTVKITTSTVKIEQGYTLQFFNTSTRTVTISYTNPECCGYMCYGCCTCKSTGYITAAELLRTLPNYGVRNGTVYFTQVGSLIWIGEKCIVDKFEERL